MENIKENRCLFVPSNTLNVKKDDDAKFFFVNDIRACIFVVLLSFIAFPDALGLDCWQKLASDDSIETC